MNVCHKNKSLHGGDAETQAEGGGKNHFRRVCKSTHCSLFAARAVSSEGMTNLTEIRFDFRMTVYPL